MPSLSVIIPAFNEQKTISQVVDAVAALPVDLEIVAVNDCSTDGTANALAESQKKHGNLRVIHHEVNGGKTAAVRTGIAASKGQVLIIQDGDLEQDPRDIPSIIQPVLDGKAEACFGSRFKECKRPDGMTSSQWFGNWCVTTFSNLLTGLQLTDVETGYKAVRGDIMRSIVLDSTGFGLEVEIPAKLAKLGLRIVEVPVTYKGRSYHEGKKINALDGVKALLFVMKYSLLYSKAESFRTTTEKPLAKAASASH